MTNSAEWGLRSYQDRPDATSWGGQNVFDVYTKSDGVALDGERLFDKVEGAEGEGTERRFGAPALLRPLLFVTIVLGVVALVAR